ncbi:unnamed protein product [Spirodela intermedia]|uniref:Uncharacterized protein n=1 Tax=Spirodela intermedia TaxID=51605 RepID=A0A7I8LED8_SPIIN|nr:unnamed protein product [Spirodela intermedia]
MIITSSVIPHVLTLRSKIMLVSANIISSLTSGLCRLLSHVKGLSTFGRIVVQCPRPRRLSLDKDDMDNL